MKILNVMLTTGQGGLEQAFLDYNYALKLRNNNVISVIHQVSSVEKMIKGEFYKISNFSKYDPIARCKLKRIVQKESPDLIITHDNRAHYIMQKVSNIIPVVGVCHNYSFDYIKNCDYIISVNKDIQQYLINHGYGQDKISHIPNMIKIPKNSQYIPPTFHNPPVIGIIARFDKLKGIDIFIKAIHLLKQENITLKAIIAGDGAEYNNIKNLIRDLKLDEDITMVGWVLDKEKFYRTLDIVCLASQQESFGIVILEGFIYSIPVIVSNVSGPMEIVKEGTDALIFQAGDFVELSKCLKRLINNHELAQTLAKNGFEKAKSYDLEDISYNIAHFLSNVK